MKKFVYVFMCLSIAGWVWCAPIADPGSRGIDWQQVKEKVEKYDWAKQIVRRMRRSVESTKSNFDAPPLGKTGWFHEYFCDGDAHQLQFDPKKPTEHRCPHCGKIYTGSPYDDCWRSKVHAQFASSSMNSAILYRITQEKPYLDFARDTLLWYANHFVRFEAHGEHAGKGWIREQSLDEATQLVLLAQAYWDICEFLTAEERETIANRFLIPDATFIQKQTSRIHNIHSWHNAAVGLVGLAVGDEQFTQKAIEGPFGLNEQIKQGIEDDGFWYEGSISYHFYTISSMQPLYIAATAHGISIQEKDKFLRMYTAPIQFTFPNGEFPANNDGWPGQSIYERASYYEAAHSFCDDDSILKVLAKIYEREDRSSSNALLFGPDRIPAFTPEQPKSVLFKDSGIAFLRNQKIDAYLKFGPYGGGHDHYDRLNLILYSLDDVLIPDLGTSGYGIPLSNRWYRTSVAHNMLVVDGKRQARCGGYLVDFNEQSVQAGVKDAYPGVDIQRKITLLPDGIQDTVTTESKTEHQYDLIYHIRGTLKVCSIPLKDRDRFEEGNGYQILTDLKTGNSEKKVSLSFQLRDRKGTMAFDCESDLPYEIYVGTCPDNPADLEMTALILRQSKDDSRFEVMIKCE